MFSRATSPRFYFSPFVNKLIQMGYIDPNQARKVLAQTRKHGRPFLQVLKEVTGKALPPDLLRQYKKYHLFELKILYGVDAFDIEKNAVDIEGITELIETLIPIEVCTRFKLIPFKKVESEKPVVVVLMVEPDNLEFLDELKRILDRKNFELQRKVITKEDYEKLLKEFSQRKSERDEQREKQIKEKEFNQLVDVSEIVENLEQIAESEDDEYDKNDISNLVESNEAPVSTLVNKILIKALQQQVSHIHIEPQENYLCIRFRKDGVLHEAFKPLPKQITQAVVNRLKLMADLEIGQKRRSQQSKIRRIFQGQKVDLRMTFLQSGYGEKVVLQVFNQSATRLGLDKFITDTNTLDKIREMCKPFLGLILVTGPVYAGKSTTLYSLLTELNHQTLNISTIEDSIEYYLPGITQIQLEKKGDTEEDYQSIIESLLLQDANVIMIEQIQQPTRAKKAVEAAMGCLVLAGLVKTTNAATPITRLMQMGIDPSILADTLLGVINQRLIRRVCSECSIAHTPSEKELVRYGLSPNQVANGTFYRANTLYNSETRENICPRCNGMGYLGQIGVYEVLSMSDRLRNLIADRVDSKTLTKFAIEEGMITLSAYAQNLVIQGYTTFEELERVFHDYYSLNNLQQNQPIINEQLETRVNRLTNELQQLKQMINSGSISSTQTLQNTEAIATLFQKQEGITQQLTGLVDEQLETRVNRLTNELQQLKQMINSGSISSLQTLQNTEAIATLFQKQEKFTKQLKSVAHHLQQLKKQVNADTITQTPTPQNSEIIPDPW